MNQRKSRPTEAAKMNTYTFDYNTKLLVCLTHLYQRAEVGLNTLEANDLYNDTCLNTTVSNIFRDYGWRLPRQYETYTNKAGRETQFMRYWLSPEQRIEVKKLLDGLDREGDA